MTMTKEDRNVRKIMAALVTGSGTRGAGTIDAAFLQGDQLKEETLFYSGWRAVRPMQDVIDFMPVLNGYTVGYKVIGKTPEGIAETARQAILERLAAGDNVSA